MPLPQAEYEAQLHALIQSQDFEGAAALQRQQGLGNSEGAAAGSGQDSECGDDVERFCEDEDVSAESCAHEEPVDEAAASVQVLKMLYKGNMEEVSRQEQQDRKAKFFSRKHSFYRNTRVTSVAQEEQSALPALTAHAGALRDEERCLSRCPAALAVLWSCRLPWPA